jgi:O-antigen/teichoic acid export membrane protein
MMKNIIYSFVSNIYSTILSIIFIPLYITLLGSERYGLVGIYLIIFPLISLLDLGFGVTIIRESAKLSGNKSLKNRYIDLMWGFEILFFIVFIISCIIILVFSDNFSNNWLNVINHLRHEASIASGFMLLTLMIRWLSIVYRSCVSGFEAIKWLSTFNAIIATLRFGAVIPILNFGNQTLIEFFGFQFMISIVELFGFWWKARHLRPKTTRSPSVRRSIKEISQVVRFTFAVSIGGLIWIAASQLDKIILMNKLSLADYGIYSIGVILASGISILSMPINIVILPRLSYLNEIGNQDGLISIYKKFTQVVSILSGTAISILLIFPNLIIFVWTGQHKVSTELIHVISLYAIGNGLLTLSIFTHYLQISKSSMKTYLSGILIFASSFSIFSVVLINRSGMVGGGQAWLIVNIAYFLIWTPIVHRLLIPKLALRWFSHDILPIIAAAMGAVYIVYLLLGVATTRWEAAIHVVIAGIVSLTIAGLTSSYVRTLGWAALKKVTHRPWAAPGNQKG